MKTVHSSIYYLNQFTHNVGTSMKVDVHLTKNPFGLPVEKLYEMAARINKKRSFLFVSKVLGKHIPLSPEVPLIASALLALAYYEEKTGELCESRQELIDALLNGSKEKLQAAYSTVKKLNYSLGQPVTFIGFAETATALGHGVFECFSDGVYIHSTRELLANQDVTLFFEEEHSHATDQRCYAPESYFTNDHTICLIDDEITTGKTALNIIASIQKRFPRKEYALLSLLDWRSKENRQRFKEFEEMHGVKIHTCALLSGTIEVIGKPDLLEMDTDQDLFVDLPNINKISLQSLRAPLPHYHVVSADSNGITNKSPYLALTGRFGLQSNRGEEVEEYCQIAGLYLQKLRRGKKTLCLGTGEFMHIPMKVAVYMGENIFYHSTTRSPIFPMESEGYPVKSRFSFESPDDPTVMNYAYNVEGNAYDEVFLFFERPIDDKNLNSMLQQFHKIPIIHIVTFT